MRNIRSRAADCVIYAVLCCIFLPQIGSADVDDDIQGMHYDDDKAFRRNEEYEAGGEDGQMGEIELSDMS